MPSTPPQQPSANLFANVFLDSEGIRPVWSITLFLTVWALLSQIILPIARTLLLSAQSPEHLLHARSEYILESASLLCVAAATWLMSKLESRAIATYGFSPHYSLRNFSTGLATGTTLLSLLVFSLHKSHLLSFDTRLLSRIAILRYATIWAIGFLLVALAEETLLRGYLQFTLTRAFTPFFHCFTPHSPDRPAFWTAALILSVTFGAIHLGNPGESPTGVVAATAVGVIFCLSLWRTGSLWWAIGFHAAWDWAQSFLYGVPDSGLLVQGRLFATHPTGRAVLTGGLTGPEGSALIFPILLLACAAVFLTQPRTRTVPF